jgi:hypothetical protein
VAGRCERAVAHPAGGAEHLREARARWETTTTEAALRPDEFPPELIERLVSVIDRIATIEERLRARSEAMGLLIDRVGDEAEVATAALDQSDLFVQATRTRILTQDEAPLWEMTRDFNAVMVDARGGIGYWGQSLTAGVQGKAPSNREAGRPQAARCGCAEPAARSGGESHRPEMRRSEVPARGSSR